MEEQRLLEARRLSQQDGHSLDQQQQQAGYSLEQQQQMAVLEEEMAVALDSSRKVSKEMIVDLVPGPVTLLMNGGGSTGAGKSGAATVLALLLAFCLLFLFSLLVAASGFRPLPLVAALVAIGFLAVVVLGAA